VTPDDPTERWLPVVGYEGLYEVSDQGRLRYADGRLVSPEYVRVKLHHGGKTRHFQLHRLIAAAFLGPIPTDQEVNHRNGLKNDNALANLEYRTHAENIRHAYATGIAVRPRGDRNHRTRYSEATKASWRRRYLAGGVTIKQLAAEAGASFCTVHVAVTGWERRRLRRRRP
jgi:hypothetical protein